MRVGLGISQNSTMRLGRIPRHGHTIGAVLLLIRFTVLTLEARIDHTADTDNVTT